MTWVFVVVTVAVAAFVGVAGWAVGRRGLRNARRTVQTLRDRIDELTLAEDRATRRAEVAESERDRERAAATEAQAELVSVVGAKRRLDVEVAELERELAATGELRQQAATAAALRQELDRVRLELAELATFRSELALSEQYVETLQRELTYRDEQVLRLEDRLGVLTGPNRAGVIDLTGDVSPEGVASPDR